ncbi:LAETG motif-containing sortase-dependent surface protein [Streptomyces sp. ME18-1-4]|uniref:LAETG motif-containing sortase-dependent surface protein n=1 Tax=Streptomyces sp. ME18-1-4 TaxID=3028685 RepID=UPI0029AEA60B|nr:LAETG motif-containing sortase-dependent surface protein [Streptomyces sp. ME18-1-4]MDX3246977.1 LAETG motif-containing sortase-dependent surface protein [Streptomyces sp. ME18-1-4]
MSIARRVTVRRLLGTGAASLTLCAASVAAASGAFAGTGAPGGDGWKSGGQYQPGTGAGTETGTDRCQFSLDGTKFFDSVRVDDQNLKPSKDGKVHITVRAAGDATTCTASLASYLAHGASFGTSGEQVFVDFDSVTVKPGQTDTLDIAVPDAGCYAQIDLYRGAVKFDGKLDAKDGFVHGDLPKGPDRPVIKDKLIAAWNGGTKDCTVTEQPPSSPPAGGGGTPSTPSSPSPSQPTAPSQSPSTSTSASPSPSASESESGTPSPSASASASTAPPAATPNGGGGDLAETGASSNTPLIAGGAAALLAGGAAIVVATRRRKALRG